MLQPKKIIGSKVSSIQAKIKEVKTKKKDLQATIRKMSKEGHRGDFGQVKDLAKMDASIKKFETQLKEMKGSGGGSIRTTRDSKLSEVDERSQKIANKNARNKQL